MSTHADRHAELLELLRGLSDGSLTPEEGARLNGLLHGDPEACELYLRHFTLEAELRHEFGGQPPLPDALPASAGLTGERIARRPRTGWAIGRSLRFAAAMLLGALLSTLAGSLLLRPGNDLLDRHEDARIATDSVATLLFADNCQWRTKEYPVEGQRLAVGPLHLERGLVILRFDGGAAVVLEGPTDLEIESRGCARLQSGRLTVRAPKEAAGFTVRSPASDVVDLGTEFAIVVERGGATELLRE